MFTKSGEHSTLGLLPHKKSYWRVAKLPDFQGFFLHIFKKEIIFGSVKFLGFHPEIFRFLSENVGFLTYSYLLLFHTDRCESKQIGTQEPID